MIKIFLRIIILLVTVVIVSIFYLSTIGVQTDKLNQKISKQIKNVDENLEIDLKNVNILLDPFKLNLNVKTVGANLRYKETIIQIENIKSNISLRALINKQNSLNNLTISTKSIKIENFLSFIKLFRNDAKIYIAEKLIKNGYLVADISVDFDDKGKIKDNYKIKGFIKDGRIDLPKDYNLSKIDLKFLISKDSFNLSEIKLIIKNNNLFFPFIKVKKENKNFLVLGQVNNKNFDLKDEKLVNLISNYVSNFKIKTINFGSESSFKFEIDNRLKIKKIEVDSLIKLKNLILKNNFKVNKFFPKIKEELQFENHNIKLDYNDKNFILEGAGKILFQENYDEIKYTLKKEKEKINFITKLDILKNIIEIDFLNYQKNLENDLTINISGNKTLDGKIFFKEISFKEKENNFLISNLSLGKNLKIHSFKNIELTYKDKDSLINKIDIKKKKNYYSLSGESLNLSHIVNEFLKFDNNKDKKDLFSKGLKFKLDIQKSYLDKNSVMKNLKGDIFFKNNEILNAQLQSTFFNQKKFLFSVKSDKNEKITTIFSEYPKPLVDNYKFIKGFEKGVLDFYSIKKNGVSKSVLIIDNFKLKEVPILAKILTLASLQGIADLLTGEGIRFTDFEMKFTNNKSLMTIDELYAIGPAISILLEGYIESKNLISLRGTLVPATTINRTIASIPLIGDILVGKKVGEGVFGVSFKIKGPPKNLETSVNPIKTLTPRFITRTLDKIKKN